MSDEDDERMDRAKRIRQMREGQRSNDGGDDTAGDGNDQAAEQADDPDDDQADDPAAEGADDSDDTSAETTDETQDEGVDDTDESDASDGHDEGDVTEPTDTAAEADADAGTDTGSTDAGTDTAEDGTDTAEDGTDTAEDGTDTAEDGTDTAEDGTDTGSTDDDQAAADERPTQTAEHATGATDAATRPTRADGAAADDTEEDSMSEHTSTTETDVSSETDDGAPDPEAIAQRAAQAAASVSEGGTEADQPSDGEPTPAETAAAIQGASGVELPDQEQIDTALEAANESIETGAETATETGAGAAAAESETTTEESTRVLEFTLGEEHYCIDISLVEEIVKRDTITRVPNTDDYIEGVVDLRGQITTILDPKELLDIDADGSETLMIVFDPEAFDDQGAIGWIVDEVRQVAPVSESEVNDPPVDEDYIEGVVDREDGFVIWTKPEVAIALATADEPDDE